MTPLRALAALLSALLVAGGAQAQLAQMRALDELAKTEPADRARIQTAFMQENLGLDSDQIEKITALNLESARKADPVLKGSDGLYTKGKKLRALQAEKNEQLRTILSPAQFEKLQSLDPQLQKRLLDELRPGAPGSGE